MAQSLSSKPIVFKGGLRKDERGSVRYVNDFNFTGVKRFYHVENSSVELIRAFHGHMKEAKYVYVVEGAILLCAVRLTSSSEPDPKQPVDRFIMKADEPTIIYIPPGYANGWKALSPESKVLFFSTSSLEDSLNDDYRFSADYWGAEVWQLKKNELGAIK